MHKIQQMHFSFVLKYSLLYYILPANANEWKTWRDTHPLPKRQHIKIALKPSASCIYLCLQKETGHRGTEKKAEKNSVRYYKGMYRT